MELLTGIFLFLVICLLLALAYESYISFNGPLNLLSNTEMVGKDVNISASVEPSSSTVNKPATPSRPVVSSENNNKYTYLTHNGKDISSHDLDRIVSNLDGCRSHCDQLLNCAGFTRPSDISDFAMGECNMKNQGKPTGTFDKWNTYEKLPNLSAFIK